MFLRPTTSVALVTGSYAADYSARSWAHLSLFVYSVEPAGLRYGFDATNAKGPKTGPPATTDRAGPGRRGGIIGRGKPLPMGVGGQGLEAGVG